MTQPTYSFPHDQTVPAMGFGTWKLKGDEARASVEYALEVGYRHLDTATVYENHKDVGASIAASDVAREDLFVTSKIWRSEIRKDDVRPAAEQALTELGLDYLNLYLIHWPDNSVPIQESLEALEEIREEGLIRNIGVSNFTVNHLKDVLKTGITIATNQVEFHPTLNQDELKRFSDENGIITTGYSPIAQGHDLKLDAVVSLSEKYEVSVAQVVLNWFIQKGMITIPRSSSKEHIKDNFGAIDFALEADDVATLDTLNQDHRIVLPEFNEFDY